MLRWIRSMGLWALAALTLSLAILGGCGGDQNVIALVDLKAPNTVQNVQAFPGDQLVRLMWSPNSEPALVGYNIYRSTGPTQGFNLVGSTGISQTPFFQDQGPDLNADGIPDGLVNNIRYFYKVTAFDRNGRESNIDLASTVSAIPGSLPPGTADLQVNNVRGYGGNGLTIIAWDLNLNSQVFGYNIYRSQVGTGRPFTLIAIVPANINSYTDAGLSNNTEFIYQVAPITSQLAEGRRTQSRSLRTQEGNFTVPKPPSSDPGNGPVTAIRVANGVQLTFGRPTQNTDGSVIGLNGQPDDLVGGGFLIKRGPLPEGEYHVVGILENIGSESNFTFVDPFGLDTDFYFIQAFDNTGNLSAPSSIVRVAGSPPAMVQGVDAFASSSAGQIIVTWNPSPTPVDGYRVYRSQSRDSGFVDISGLLPNTVTSFTDADPSLAIGQTFFYKVLAEAGGIKGSPSPPAPATPGPASGIFYLEGEDATVTISNANDFTAINRQSFPAPFSGNGVLFIKVSNAAVVGVTFAQLAWSQDIDATRSVVPIVRSYDVYLITARNSSSGIFGITIGEVLAAATAAPFNCQPLRVTSKDFFKSNFGFPPTQSVERIGTICFADESSFPPNGPNENITMTLTYQGANPAIAQGRGELFLDAVVLVRR